MSLLESLFKKNLRAKPGLCGLHITRDGIAIAYITQKNNIPTLETCDFIPLNSLKAYVDAHNLTGVKCSWILQPNDYQLLPVGVLPVAENEVAQAIRWHIKDRIDFPIDNASIVHFTVPDLHKSAKEDFIYAVVSKKDFLDSMATLIRESGLDLRIIDIPEFAIRNILSLQPTPTHSSIGLIETNECHTTVMLMKNNTIYLIRQILSDGKKDKIYAEIQRSLDYYENDLGQPPVTNFYVPAAYYDALPELKNCLALTLNPLLSDAEKSRRCFTAIGGALRREDNHVTTN